MWKYIVKRLLTMIPILLVVSFLVFWLMTFTGDPIINLTGDSVTAEELEALREAAGLNDPLLVRYGRYMWDLLHGDLGTNMYGRQVWDEFIVRFPSTVALALAGMFVTVLLSIPIGIIAAVKQNTWVDSSLSAIAMAGISMPSFWLGLMLPLFFSIKLGWLPATGNEGWKSIVMPAICVGLNFACVLTRMTRSSMVDVIRADFLRTARAKGCSEKTVILKHALGNALIPILTIMGSQFSILLGGTAVIEAVFNWPGLGQYVITCIRSADYVGATSIIIIMTTLTALVLLATDVLYAFVDPRIKARYSA